MKHPILTIPHVLYEFSCFCMFNYKHFPRFFVVFCQVNVLVFTKSMISVVHNQAACSSAMLVRYLFAHPTTCVVCLNNQALSMFCSKHFTVRILEPLIKLLCLEPGCVEKKTSFSPTLIHLKPPLFSLYYLSKMKWIQYQFWILSKQPRLTQSVFTRIRISAKIHGHPCFISSKRDAFNQS